jgi:hypothetical protein
MLLWPIVLLCLSGVVLAEGCSPDHGGAADAALIIEGAASCPPVAPPTGSVCAGATSCVYGAVCQQTLAVCSGGRWMMASPADAGDCPATAPDNGASCSVCGPTTPCAYNLACDVDGGTSVTALCTTHGELAEWVVSAHACGLQDAGVDRDAEAGASQADAADARDGSDLREGGRDAHAVDGSGDGHAVDGSGDGHAMDGSGDAHAMDGSGDARAVDGGA